MKKNENNNRLSYTSPKIECITLDNEISLQLESAPHGPGEDAMNVVPEHFNNDAMKSYYV